VGIVYICMYVVLWYNIIMVQLAMTDYCNVICLFVIFMKEITIFSFEVMKVFAVDLECDLSGIQ
jgi:hypothetical protein